ncbi:glycosyltransferase family 4 protein [Pseudoalteromonas luteoviolacea]|uniref:glycosyltransferase family 4 protein n=1 Tax=Pseudoalteromonas luteoviolacea TaxID=43657 RepID=UPI001B38106B|nr:glycosyltransferase family 4 protein [Pseudoalteromonas luteoviolacea]MBQ4810557.1 glycosyltransferase family 4 protein [Pseudoalteromonas luteoviolacea]
MKHIAIYTDSRNLQEVAMLISEANALAEMGHKVTIITNVKYKNVRNLKPDVNMKYVPTPGISDLAGQVANFKNLRNCFSIWYKYRVGSLISLLCRGLKLAKVLQQNDIDHIHFESSEAMYPASLASANCVGASISSFSDVACPKGPAKWVADTCNLSVLELESLRTTKNSEAIVLKRGLDLSLYKTAIKNKSAIKLIFVGNIVEGSGLQYLLKALAALPSRTEVMIDVVGNGPMKKQLVNALIKLRLNQKVHFLGDKPRKWLLKNLPKYSGMITPFCSDADVINVNNINYIKEAMACGLPILTSNIAVCDELTSSNTGMKCPPNSVDALKNMLLAFLKLGPYHQHLLGENARKYAEQNYNVKHQARTLSRWIQAL